MGSYLLAWVHDILESVMAISLHKTQNLKVQRTEMLLVILAGDLHGDADVAALPPAMQLLDQN